MVSINSNTKCDQAKLYYYDYLHKFKADIPINISRHIDECSLCQNEIRRLEQIIIKDENGHEGSKQIDSIIATSLRLHFAFENTMVTCQTVRPFLPSLAAPLLKIRIPTPITVHIDNCQTCKENLQKIQSLNLSLKQLFVLGQIFAEPNPGKELCIKAQEAIPHVVALTLSETTSEILKHICTCPDCRLRLYQRRDLVFKDLSKTNIEKGDFPCESVLSIDIFDYCFPYGMDIENDQYAKFRTALTSHISVCVACLNKMQQLHKTISGILECPNSGIVTYYQINPNQKTQINNTSTIYREWPIEVKVYDSPQRNSMESLTLSKPKARKRTYIGRFAKFLSAAAVILFFLILYFSPSAAKAVSLDQIYKALSRLQNVYFATYIPDKDVPTQEKWISAALNTILVKGESRIDLWDINNKVQKSIDLKTSNSSVTRSEYKDWDSIKNIVLPPWGLLPFNDIDDAPKNSDAQWQKIADKTSSVTIENTEIYELTWKERTTTESWEFKKWVGYVDRSLKLPKRIEFWQKTEPAEQYELKLTQIIEFPSAAKIEQLIKKFGFK
jgi:hypothetical protein